MGFTLLEIMIVVLILSILIAIAVPGWFRNREQSRKTACISNLAKIDAAKEQWVMANKASNGAPILLADIYPTYLKVAPSCPSGGIYTVGNAGTDPTCSFGFGHAYP
jgi:prepilin-type N-terminal cleavage/methylation domain-containing protein